MLFPHFLLFALPLIRAAAVPNSYDSHDHSHSHDVRQPLPNTWYHARDHPVHELFKRAPGDGTNYAPVGTPGKRLVPFLFQILSRISMVCWVSASLPKSKCPSGGMGQRPECGCSCWKDSQHPPHDKRPQHEPSLSSWPQS